MRIISYSLDDNLREELKVLYKKEEYQVNYRHKTKQDIIGKENLIEKTKQYLNENY